jgi:hypothetical protein
VSCSTSSDQPHFQGDVLFDPTGTYRYHLSRSWDQDLPSICWVMLNPSTADATSDDATICRVVGFSRAWGHGSVSVVNLFALRTPHPRDLRTARRPVGPRNDDILLRTAVESDCVIAAWGNGGHLHNPSTGIPRSREVQGLLHDVGVTTMCLGRTGRGEPRHPLYMARASVLVPT